ncbi:MAG: site-specific integrase [Fimbriimonadales bacterium]|nr:site-specific integrase [Fimbriimonadales bacterium]
MVQSRPLWQNLLQRRHKTHATPRERMLLLIDLYLNYRRGVCSNGTYRLDNYHLDFLRRYLRESPPAETERELLLGYLAWLRQQKSPHTGKPYTPDTLAAACERLSALLNWAVEEGHLERLPLKRKELLKRPEPLPEPLTPDEVRTLLQRLNGRRWIQVRNRAIVITCLELGCRRGELLQMKVGDLKRGYSEVRQKGNRPHVMHLTTSACEAIERYLHALQRDTGVALPDTHPLWLNGRLRPMHGQDLRRAFARLSKRIGIRIYIHRLRATSATLRLALGASTEVVRRALGHSTDRVLRHYVRLAESQQRALMEATSPTRNLLEPAHSRRTKQQPAVSQERENG